MCVHTYAEWLSYSFSGIMVMRLSFALLLHFLGNMVVLVAYLICRFVYSVVCKYSVQRTLLDLCLFF